MKPTRHNGTALRCFRVKAGYKPGQFASMVSLSYAHLDNLENERKQASPEVLCRIARALEIPVGALLRDDSMLTMRRTA